MGNPRSKRLKDLKKNLRQLKTSKWTQKENDKEERASVLQDGVVLWGPWSQEVSE
jgi:hypothetical protein